MRGGVSSRSAPSTTETFTYRVKQCSLRIRTPHGVPTHGELRLTTLSTSGNVATISAASSRPMRYVHASPASMYDGTTASPHPFGICGLPPESNFGASGLLSAIYRPYLGGAPGRKATHSSHHAQSGPCLTRQFDKHTPSFGTGTTKKGHPPDALFPLPRDMLRTTHGTR